MFQLDTISTQKDRVAIVTGANVGLGFESALALAEKNMTVIMACRSEQKAQKAIEAIRQQQPNAQLDFIALNLSDLSSVGSFAEAFNTKYDRLDVLMNNAGVMMPPYEKTVDGFELQMGANYLGHFLLTSLLLPVLEKTTDSRIVQLSSIVHRTGRIHFDDMQFEKSYSPSKAYGQSKLAMLMFAYELDRQLKERGYQTLSVAAHPGVSSTALTRHFPGFIAGIVKAFLQSAKQGALPQLYAALGDDIQGGDYTGPNGFREIRGHAVKVSARPHAHDLSVAKKLWDLSIELTGAEFFPAQ